MATLVQAVGRRFATAAIAWRLWRLLFNDCSLASDIDLGSSEAESSNELDRSMGRFDLPKDVVDCGSRTAGLVAGGRARKRVSRLAHRLVAIGSSAP